MGLRPLPADYQPETELLPGVVVDEVEEEVTDEEMQNEYKSCDQLGAELVTLSQLPESRWRSLLHLDEIKVSTYEKERRVMSSLADGRLSCFECRRRINR